MRRRALLLLLVALPLAACERPPTAIQVRSSAFRDGGAIPERYSCEGDNQAPPLAWTDVPEGTQELAVVLADLDAPNGIFHHWIVLGIRPDVRAIRSGERPVGAVEALTTADSATYIGPCPPPGEEHTYVLTVFPLRRRLGLADGAPTKEALDAIDAARIAGEGELRGTFRR